MPGTLIVIETSAGEVRESCFELVTAAKTALDSGQISAIVIGHEVSEVADQVAALEVELVLVADRPEFERYTPDAYCAAIELAIVQTNPELVLFSGTTSGRDLGAYLAARSNQECISDCLDVQFADGVLTAVRPVYQGKMLVDVSCAVDSTAYAVVRAGSYEAPHASTTHSRIETMTFEVNPDEQRTMLKEVTTPPAGDVNLADASIVVVGGRGVGSAENFSLIEDLAHALDAPVGATRAVTDLGWRPHFEQIGQTGKSIHPQLYIGAGVSGAVQHTVGMRGSETILAINRDPGAPIFRISDIGVVGDLNEILPALTNAVLEAKSN